MDKNILFSITRRSITCERNMKKCTTAIYYIKKVYKTQDYSPELKQLCGFSLIIHMLPPCANKHCGYVLSSN